MPMRAVLSADEKHGDCRQVEASLPRAWPCTELESQAEARGPGDQN